MSIFNSTYYSQNFAKINSKKAIITKIEDKSDDEEQNSTNDIENEDEGQYYPPFANCRPRKVDFTDIFPQYPKTHQHGYATVVELPETTLTEEICTKLRNLIQYSWSNLGGGGSRIKNHVEFFAKDDENQVPMIYNVRQCAGVKVCEFFPKSLMNHTEVDEDVALEWAQRLAEQEKRATNKSLITAQALWEKMGQKQCERYVIGGIRLCEGRTMIKSFNIDPDAPWKSAAQRLFIGCEHWQHKREKGHIFEKLDGVNPIDVLRVWGRERC